MIRRFCFCFAAVLLVSGIHALGQGAYTSSDVEIDSASGMVTATCETDLDNNSETYYLPTVGCTLRDGNGKYLAGGGNPDDDDTGSAVIVLQVQGIPGTTYVVTGTHGATTQYSQDGYDDPDDPNSASSPYIDEFNFEQIQTGDNTPFSSYYDYVGPGPEVQTRTKYMNLGSTSDSATDPPLVPTTTVLTSNTLTTYANQTVTSCDGTQVYANNAYGYGRCIDYQIYDQNTEPLLQAMTVHEVIANLANNFTPVNMTGDDQSNTNGIFEDFVSLLGSSALPVNACAYSTQTFSAQSQTIRVNCLHYTATDVTITNITTNPNSCPTTCP